MLDRSWHSPVCFYNLKSLRGLHGCSHRIMFSRMKQRSPLCICLRTQWHALPGLISENRSPLEVLQIAYEAGLVENENRYPKSFTPDCNNQHHDHTGSHPCDYTDHRPVDQSVAMMTVPLATNFRARRLKIPSHEKSEHKGMRVQLSHRQRYTKY